MLKLFLLFLFERGVERVEARYKSEYEKLSHGVKIKEADNERRSNKTESL